MSEQQPYIAALKYVWLDRFYDPLIRLTMSEKKFRTALIEQARIDPGMKILDIGCGTGTQALALYKKHPDINIHGLDGDLRILRIAEKKIHRLQITAIDFCRGFSQHLPFKSETFDRAFSTLMFHHLSTENKVQTLRESYRVLKARAELHIADFGKPHTLPMKILSMLPRLLDGMETTRDNFDGLLPDLIRKSGFTSIITNTFSTPFGSLVLHKAVKQ